MFKLSIKVFFAVLFFFVVHSSFAQQAAQAPAIVGRVIDSVTRKPLDFITVSVFNDAGVALASGYTNAGGAYKLSVKKAGKIRIVYSFVGYAEQELTVLLTQQQILNIKDIKLSPDVKNLDEVQILAAKKLLVQRPGMLIYNAGNDPSNKGGTAADVLRKAPVLSVDARGNVSMRGSGNIKILVDGKYSGQMARSPADALNMMPADVIQSVEVITTPSAKYDAEGAAGVINIITKKGNKQFSGSLEAAVSNWEQVLNPRIAVANKKWNINANAHLHRLRMKSVNDYQRVNMDGGSTTSVLDQHIVEENVAPHGSASVTVDYAADSLNQISFGVTSWFGNWPDNSRLNSKVTLPNGEVAEMYNQVINSQGKYLGADINIGYTHKFKKPGQEVTLLAQMSPSRDNSRYNSNQTSTDNALLYRELNNSLTNNREWTFQADYLQPIGNSNKYSFEGGAKVISRKVSNNYNVAGSSESQPDVLEPIADRTNIFDYKQDVVAGYMIFKFNFPGNWYAETGARVEGTFLKGDFISGGNSFSKNFTNIVPTATVSKKLSDAQTLSLSYTKRLTRPYIWDLNPNANASDPKNIVTGNPQLDPEMAHQAELSYSISLNSGLSFNPAIFWKQTNNSIEDITTVGADGISVTSKQNLAANRQFGLNMSASIPINKKWGFNTNINVTKLDFKSTVLQIISNGWGSEFNVNTTYKLPRNLSLQAFGTYNTRTITLQGYETRNYYYTFAAKKEITAQKITLTLATINPFTKAVQQTEVVRSSSFYGSSLNREYNQTIKLTVGWEFGKLFKQTESKKIQNDDVKGQAKG
ncbi:TonB-dependent receptor [Mucilaginibacter sp. JRF]|uniref:outer membrane beta-barrel protein n=1 Tax=Mucilaginibacter sp. JRF TaxID=2780088 RepID=UPI0018822307|nr:outer membrane beta-barrel family protein [Mucilaginibacter sp. JRF]MBE9586437.1 TonB-dependent receptor [Mucilaginibacter sp. JRF]